jgi:hypothetical protein
MAKQVVGEEYLRSILHAAVKAELTCAGVVKGIEITRHDGQRANWDAALLRAPEARIPGDCMRAFLAAKSKAFDDFELKTYD